MTNAAKKASPKPGERAKSKIAIVLHDYLLLETNRVIERFSPAPDRHHGPLSVHQLAEQVTQALQPVFLIEKLVAVLLFASLDDSGFGIDPWALYHAASRARSNANPRIVPDSFHFSGVCQRVDVEEIIVLGKPYRGGNRRTILPVGFEAQIALRLELFQLD
jgi:hypothetical protein